MQIGSFDEMPMLADADAIGVPQAIAPGMWRIVLPLPFALAVVNVYVLHGDNEWCLIDCGLGTRASDAALAKGLAELGITYADLATLVLTHSHPDHCAPLGDIVAQMPTTSRVVMLGLEADVLYQIWGPQSALAHRALYELRRLGGLDVAQADLGSQGMTQMGRLMRVPARERITDLHDGETLMLAGRPWQVLWTPGHAEGHICLVNESTVILGDHILPRISPNISLYPCSRPDPVQDYRDSLDRIAALPIADPCALPGHGLPFTALATRIAELHASTDRRSHKTLDALREASEPLTALAVAETIFAGRLHDADDRWMALGETQAHLEHLRLHGQATRTDRDGVAYYHAE